MTALVSPLVRGISFVLIVVWIERTLCKHRILVIFAIKQEDFMGYMKCVRCGVGYEGHHLSRYCGGCKPLVVSGHRAKWVVGREGAVGAYDRWKASVLRGVGDKQRGKRAMIKFGESEFNSVVGVCGYCGSPGFGLSKRVLDGLWEIGNVICCCGVCGGMKRGLGHADFVGRCVTISSCLT